MYCLIRYPEDGVLHVLPKKNIISRKNKIFAKYLDGRFYNACVLNRGCAKVLKNIREQLLHLPVVRLLKCDSAPIKISSIISNITAGGLNDTLQNYNRSSTIAGGCADDNATPPENYLPHYDTVGNSINVLADDTNTASQDISNIEDTFSDFEPGSCSISTPANATIVHTSLTKKKLFCTYCKTLQSNLSRHLKRKHADEPAMRSILLGVTGVAERKRIYHRIRSRGTLEFNTNSAYNDGSLIVTRAPRLPRSTNHYLPCASCGAYYAKSNLYKHRRICPTSNEHSDIYESRIAARRHHHLANEFLQQNIFPPLLDDEFSNALKFYKLIVIFGNSLTFRYRQPHLHYHIRQILRTLARFLLTIRSLNPDIRHLADIFKPKHYDLVLRGINVLAKFDPRTGSYGVPSIATRLGTYLKKCCDLFVMDCIKTGSLDEKRDANDFLKIFNADFSSSVNKTATETQNEVKRNKRIELPLQDDIHLLSSFLNENIDNYYKSLTKQYSFTSWSHLSKYLLCYLQVFNRKRAGEIERLLISDFKKFDSLDQEKSSVLYNSLTPDEQALADTFVKIDIRGKRGRTVPIIVTKNHYSIIDFVLSQRQVAGVHVSNPYVFAAPSSAYSHYRACDTMKQCALDCGASAPHKLTGTSLRKHLATTAQILELGENAIGRLANFMGHDVAIHKEHYRLPSTAVDLSQTSKILMLMEEKNVENFRGKSIADIQYNKFSDNPSASDDDGDEDHRLIVHNNTKKTKGRKRLAPVLPFGKTVRRPWTSSERSAIYKYFDKYIQDRRLPKYTECVTAKTLYPQLSSRSPTHIKAFINNEINRIKKANSTI